MGACSHLSGCTAGHHSAPHQLNAGELFYNFKLEVYITIFFFTFVCPSICLSNLISILLQIQKKILSLYICLLKKCNFAKLGEFSAKIEPATPISILKFKRAWQTQFFSLTLQILVNDRFFIGNQMIFYSIFCISNRKAEI